MLLAEGSGSKDRNKSPVIVWRRIGPSNDPLAIKPNSAQTDTQVTSVSWPVNTARGDGFSSKDVKLILTDGQKQLQ